MSGEMTVHTGTPGALVPQAPGAAGMQAGAIAEIRFAMEMAIAHPRDEDDVRTRMVNFCTRPAFADKALYAFPRAGSMITGPSIKLAEELAKCWRNIRWGHYTVMDDGPLRTVRGWAWDLENNARKEVDHCFEKLLYRKSGGRDGKGGWVEPDARELMELTNAQGSKAARNAILGLLPWDLVEDAKQQCVATQQKADKADPERARKTLVAAFAQFGVSGSELAAFLGKPLGQMVEEDTVLMRSIYTGLHSGEVSWQEILGKEAEKQGVGKAKSAQELRRLVEAKAAGAAQAVPPAETPEQGKRGNK